jgi:hypothetical protein
MLRTVVLALFLLTACSAPAQPAQGDAGWVDSRADLGAQSQEGDTAGLDADAAVGPDGTSDSADVVPVPSAPAPWAERRIVAVGDVHGDVNAARMALRLAGAIDDSDTWIGGDLVVVQVGDQLDRGDTERQILDLFEVLRGEAEAAGGGFYPLLGNHEVMNVQLDLRYVTEGGYDEFSDVPYEDDDPELSQYEPEQRGRVAAFRPGGPYALLLSEHLMVLQLGRNVFVHGGLVPRFARLGIDRINGQTSAWMRGEAAEPSSVRGDDCPIWSRHFSDETGPAECALLEETLDLLDADRMIVAHTVQDDGINSACDGRVWRIDVGLAAYYGGELEVLEILGDTVEPVAR